MEQVDWWFQLRDWTKGLHRCIQFTRTSPGTRVLTVCVTRKGDEIQAQSLSSGFDCEVQRKFWMFRWGLVFRCCSTTVSADQVCVCGGVCVCVCVCVFCVIAKQESELFALASLLCIIHTHNTHTHTHTPHTHTQCWSEWRWCLLDYLLKIILIGGKFTNYLLPSN